MENQLWKQHIFGRHDGESVTNVLFWYTSKMFGLRASNEHRQLEVGQFSIGTDHNGKYLGRSCKNWQGGLHQRKIKPKHLKRYSRPHLGDRCAVSILEYYGPFYRRPFARLSSKIFSSSNLSHQFNENFVKRPDFMVTSLITPER